MSKNTGETIGKKSNINRSSTGKSSSTTKPKQLTNVKFGNSTK